MTYKLVITEYADELLDHILYYIFFQLKNELAVKHLLNGIEDVYSRLEENPLQFPISKDTFLAQKGYHEAVVPHMNYIIIYDIQGNTVNVVGIFHQSENYQNNYLK